MFRGKLYFLIFLLLMCFAVDHVWAEVRKFDGSLETGVLFSVHSLPSSVRGGTSFSVPHLKARFELTNEDENSFEIQLKGTDNRDSTSKKFQVLTKKASLHLRSPFTSAWEVEAGLVENPWTVEAQNLWNFQFWGNSSEPALLRYKYLAESELGVHLFWTSESGFSASFSTFNGESNQKDEPGTRKTVQLMTSWQGQNWGISLAGAQGAYDDYEAEINSLERALVRVTFESDDEDFLIAAEAYWTRDPSLAVTALSFAEAADFSSRPGESLRGQGWSLQGRWKMNEAWNLHLRRDDLNPATNLPQRGVQSSMAAVSYEASNSLSFAEIYTRTDLGELHSLQSKANESLISALRLNF